MALQKLLFLYEYGIHGLQALYGPHNKYKTNPDSDLEHSYGHQSIVEYDIHYLHRKVLNRHPSHKHHKVLLFCTKTEIQQNIVLVTWLHLIHYGIVFESNILHFQCFLV
ncbi:hypothetical protein D9M71_770120 [compost metagenome]